jgi:hypothetical protein
LQTCTFYLLNGKCNYGRACMKHHPNIVHRDNVRWALEPVLDGYGGGAEDGMLAAGAANGVGRRRFGGADQGGVRGAMRGDGPAVGASARRDLQQGSASGVGRGGRDSGALGYGPGAEATGGLPDRQQQIQFARHPAVQPQQHDDQGALQPQHMEQGGHHARNAQVVYQQGVYADQNRFAGNAVPDQQWPQAQANATPAGYAHLQPQQPLQVQEGSLQPQAGQLSMLQTAGGAGAAHSMLVYAQQPQQLQQMQQAPAASQGLSQAPQYMQPDKQMQVGLQGQASGPASRSSQLKQEPEYGVSPAAAPLDTTMLAQLAQHIGQQHPQQPQQLQQAPSAAHAPGRPGDLEVAARSAATEYDQDGQGRGLPRPQPSQVANQPPGGRVVIPGIGSTSPSQHAEPSPAQHASSPAQSSMQHTAPRHQASHVATSRAMGETVAGRSDGAEAPGQQLRRIDSGASDASAQAGGARAVDTPSHSMPPIETITSVPGFLAATAPAAPRVSAPTAQQQQQQQQQQAADGRTVGGFQLPPGVHLAASFPGVQLLPGQQVAVSFQADGTAVPMFIVQHQP